MKSIMRQVVVVAAVSILPAAAFAATAADVLNDLHKSNITEIHMGKLAEARGFSQDTKDYGKTLVDDHTDADKKVMDVAAKENITLKAVTKGPMMKMEMDKLKMHKGAAFDKSFSEAMISDHQSDIKKLDDAQKSDLPQDVRDLIASLQPTLQKHLETAQKINANSNS